MTEPIHLRFRNSPLLWLRASGLAMIGVLCVSAVTQQEQLLWQVPVWLTLVIFGLYAVTFVRNTAPFPRLAPWQKWLLLAQLGLSLPFDGSLSVVTAITIPLVTAGRRRRWWLAGTIAAVGSVLAARVALSLVQNRDKIPADTKWISVVVTIAGGMLELMSWHLFAFLAALLIVHVDADRRRLAQLNAELKGAQILLMDSGRLAERLRIARELHDSMGHHLISMSLQLEAAGHLPESQLRGQLAQVRFISRLLLADVREAVSEWRGETSTALPEALRVLTGAVAGTRIRLDVEDAMRPVSPAITHALFRCAQEAITNAVKHGEADEIAVRLWEGGGALELEIADNGRGAAAVQPGNGLTGMRARVEELGGSVAFTTAQKAGFRVAIQVPLAAEAGV